MGYLHQMKLYNGKSSIHILLQGGPLLYFFHFDWNNQLFMGLISVHFPMNQGLWAFMSNSWYSIPRLVVSTSLVCIGYTQAGLTTTPPLRMTDDDIISSLLWAYQMTSHGIGYHVPHALMKRWTFLPTNYSFLWMKPKKW